MNEETIIIGNEYDEELIMLLFEVLQSMKAIKLEENKTLVGSQDLYFAKFNVNGSIVKIEIETYIGISVISTPKVVTDIKNKIDMLKNRSQ